MQGKIDLTGDDIVCGGLVGSKLLYSKNQENASNTTNASVDLVINGTSNGIIGGLYGVCSGSLKTTNVTLKLEASDAVKAYIIAYTLKDTLVTTLRDISSG